LDISHSEYSATRHLLVEFTECGYECQRDFYMSIYTTIRFTCSVIESPYPSDNIRCPCQPGFLDCEIARSKKKKSATRWRPFFHRYRIVRIWMWNVGQTNCPHEWPFEIW